MFSSLGTKRITKFYLHFYKACQEKLHWLLLHGKWQRPVALQGTSRLRGNWKAQLQPQRHRIMKRAFKRGNESLQISLLKHGPRNFTGMRKTLARACSNYVQSHKYEKYFQLAFPRQMVNKHSFLTLRKRVSRGEAFCWIPHLFLYLYYKDFSSLSPHWLFEKKKKPVFKCLSLVFNPSRISLLGEGGSITNIPEGEMEQAMKERLCSSRIPGPRKFPGAALTTQGLSQKL